MKQYRKALILSSIALVLGSVLLALLLLADSKEPVPQTTTIYEINSFSVADISAVAVNNATGAYGFILGPEGYISVVPEQEPEGDDYSQEELRAFVFLLSKLSASQAIDGGVAAAEFGLDQPLARISMILKDSNTLRFILGNQSPVDDSYYFQKEGDPRVYLIGKTTASLMLRGRLDYWNKELLSGITTESLELLRSISLWSAKHIPQNWTLEHPGDFSFLLTEPHILNVKTDNVFSRIILPLTTLRPGQFLGLSDDLTSYGLDKPDYTLTITHGDTTQVLLFSQDGQGGFHASRKGKTGVFSIPGDRLEFLNLSYRELIGDYIYNGSMASVDTIELSRPLSELTYRLALFGEGAQLYGIMNGQSIPYTQVTTALKPLYEIGIVGEVRLSENHNNEARTALERSAHTRIHIAKRDGTKDVLEFHSLDEALSLVRINGNISFTTYTWAAQAIEDSLAGISQ